MKFVPGFYLVVQLVLQEEGQPPPVVGLQLEQLVVELVARVVEFLPLRTEADANIYGRPRLLSAFSSSR